MGDRSRALDLLKWLALLTMVIDHLRYLPFDQLGGLVIPGRVAFPLFCLVIAAHVARQVKGTLSSTANWLYIRRLVIFGFIAEPIYILYFDKNQANILFSLALGLIIALSYHHRHQQPAPRALMFTSLVLAFVCRDFLPYGLAGVLLPVSMLFAMTFGSKLAILAPVACAFLANLPNAKSIYVFAKHPQGMLDNGFDLVLVHGLIAALASAWGLWLVRQQITFSVPAVGQWAYWFYPAHLLVLYGISIAISI